MSDPQRWARHDDMSDPAGYGSKISALPSTVVELNAVIQGVLVHSDWLGAYGLDATSLSGISRKSLPVGERIKDIFARDSSPLEVARPPGRRAIGTCRDYALLLCSILRTKGISARVRCGFAAYFGSGWEDHWVCEYQEKGTGDWRLSDAQLDEVFADKLKIEFHPADVPREKFITAGQAWREVSDRSSRA